MFYSKSKMNDILYKMSMMANSINALENQVIVLQQENAQLKKDLKCANDAILDIHLPIDNIINVDNKPIADKSYDIKQVYSMMKERAPKAYDFYLKLMKNNEEEYVSESVSSLAAEGDIESVRFAKFLSRYLYGNVLDIGCGPLELPLYLKGYPVENIYGLDPLPPHASHPFSFVQGVAEKIPWGDESFDNLIFATSFDHILLVDLVMKEVFRVLKSGGFLLMWVSFDENAKAYDPYKDEIEPYDRFHMFHNTKTNFEEIMEGWFTIVEYYKSNVNTHFYAMKKDL